MWRPIPRFLNRWIGILVKQVYNLLFYFDGVVVLSGGRRFCLSSLFSSSASLFETHVTCAAAAAASSQYHFRKSNNWWRKDQSDLAWQHLLHFLQQLKNVRTRVYEQQQWCLLLAAPCDEFCDWWCRCLFWDKKPISYLRLLEKLEPTRVYFDEYLMMRYSRCYHKNNPTSPSADI